MQMMHADTNPSLTRVDALGSDGAIVHLRELGPDDLAALADLHTRASEESIRLRFFGAGRSATQAWERHAVTPDPQRCTLGAFRDGTLVGCGSLEVLADTAAAEFALLVADPVQHSGIGTLLLEHLVSQARDRGAHRLVGEVMVANSAMLQVVRDFGLPVTVTSEAGDVHVELDLDVTEGALDAAVDAISAREQAASVASLRPLLAPRSVVVVGAGRRAGSVGHEVLRNVLTGGFPGAVFAVNPHGGEVLGVRCYPDVADLPVAPDLAVIALPATRVPAAVLACGQRGVAAAVLLGSGFGEAGSDGAVLQDEVLRIAREHGVRLLGPNCVGLVNTDPQVRLNATFAVLAPEPGHLAVLAQSGAFGIGVLSALAGAGSGVAQFVSIGNKIDVAGNDLLLAWEHDDRIRVIGAYLESIGDPRRFARIARHVSAHKPVLVVKSGRTDVGRRAGASHTAAAATSEVALEALFRSSGVLRLPSMRALIDAARVLADQPPPRGARVAIVGNSGGPEILAADAAADAGLVVAPFDEDVRRALAGLGLPEQNPLDLGAAVTPEQARAAVEIVTRSAAVDAVITVFADVAITDGEAMSGAVAAAASAAAVAGKPVVAVAVGAPPSTRPLPGTPWKLPVLSFPEDAAAALGVARRYAALRSRPARVAPRPTGTFPEVARALVARAEAAGTEWLPAEEAFGLLKHYGIPVAPYAVVGTPEEAVAAARRLGFPLAAKIATPGAHKSDVGGVRLGIPDDTELVPVVRELTALGQGTVLLQRMARPGTELIVGSVHDPQCGPLVMVGAGGVLTDVLQDRAFALAPLDAGEAADLIAGLRSARLLDGFRGMPVVDRSAVADVLARVSALVDDIPEIAELDINPLIARGREVVAVDVRVRLAAPPAAPDPLVRRLRGPRTASIEGGTT